MLINILYPLCSFGAIFGTIYGFSYGVISAKNDISRTFPKLNKNNCELIGLTFALNSNKIIFHTCVGFFYGLMFPIYPLYKIYINKKIEKHNQNDIFIINKIK